MILLCEANRDITFIGTPSEYAIQEARVFASTELYHV